MSLSNSAAIDLVSMLPGEPGRSMLIIYDNGEITDGSERERAFKKKLSPYVLFVRSGQFSDVYPGLSDAVLSIEVVCSLPPTEGMKSIAGMHSRGVSNLFLPVNISEEVEFRRKMGLPGVRRSVEN